MKYNASTREFRQLFILRTVSLFFVFVQLLPNHDQDYHAWYSPSLSLSLASNLLSYPLCDMYFVLFITIVYTNLRILHPIFDMYLKGNG
jgi:hypothetical protein